MTFGDCIRNKNNKELAEMLINTITANSDLFEEYMIELGGYHRFMVTDANELEKLLGWKTIE